MSLLDEQSLVLLDTPKKLLSYRGQVHVRDLALMLEEVLYYYRPDGELLIPVELVYVLSEYDKWIEHNAVPLSAEVLQSVTVLSDLNSETTDEEQGVKLNLGYFHQETLVNSMRFSQLAQTIGSSAANPSQQLQRKPSSPWNARQRQSCQWQHIRLYLDAISGKTNGSSSSPTARAVQRDTTIPSPSTTPRLTNTNSSALFSPPSHVCSEQYSEQLSPSTSFSIKSLRGSPKHQQYVQQIAHKTVSYKTFARWIYKILNRILHQRTLKHSSNSNNGMYSFFNILYFIFIYFLLFFY